MNRSQGRQSARELAVRHVIRNSHEHLGGRDHAQRRALCVGAWGYCTWHAVVHQDRVSLSPGQESTTSERFVHGNRACRAMNIGNTQPARLPELQLLR